MRWAALAVLFVVLSAGLVYMGYRQGLEAYLAGYNQGYVDGQLGKENCGNR